MDTLETVCCSGITLHLPPDLCRHFPLLQDIISPETWNNCLTDDNREKLMGLLPTFPENDLEEKTRTLEMFFMDVNFRYGTPLRQFHSALLGGHFGPAVIRLRKRKIRLDKKLFRYQQREYLHHMLESTIVHRQELLETVNSLPPPGIPASLSLPPPPAPPWRPPLEARVRRRYRREIQAMKAEAGIPVDSSDEDTELAIVSKKQRRQLCGVEASLPASLLPVRHTHSTGSLAKDMELFISPQYNPLDLTEAHFQPIMDRYISSKRTRRKRGLHSLSEDTRGITLSDVISRASQTSKRLLLTPPPSGPGRGAVGEAKAYINRAKTKKEKHNSSPAAGHTMLVKEECEVEESMGRTAADEDDQDQTFPSLARYVTMASGEVKNEAVEEGDDRPMGGPVMSTAKRRLLTHGARQKNKCDDVLLNGITNGLTEVKEEPADEVEDTWPTDNDVIHSNTVSQGILQQSHSCFFCLLRDVICQPRDQRLSRSQLESSIRAWQQAPAAQQNAWHQQAASWIQLLPSAVNFLAGYGGEGQPADFVPYLEYKAALQAYQWIGAGRDTDAKLQHLYQHWMTNRSLVCSSWLVSWGSDGAEGGVVTAGPDEDLPYGEDGESSAEEVIPAPRCPTTWTVQPASAQEKQAFRQQEKQRYEKPHRAFTYKVHGYEAVVGPVKGIYSQHSGPNKARGHSLLTPHRPAYVTILALVRDAVARLPNGEGTRAEICELLRESQYLAPLHNATAESALNSVVSGALDRLHYEQDPCVKYLANRKMWVYLHRYRDEQEFERMHHLNGPGSTKNKKPPQRRHPRPKTPAKEPVKPPPNVAIDPHTNVVKVEGGLVQVRPEDVLVRPTMVTNANSSVVSLVSSPTARTTTLTSPTAALTPNKTITAVKVSGGCSTSGNVRTLMASNLQTIQVSTTSGIHTIKVALPPGTTPAHHFAKGTLVGRLAGPGSPVTAARNLKELTGQQQPIGQLVQTSTGATQFIGVRPRTIVSQAAAVATTASGIVGGVVRQTAPAVAPGGQTSAPGSPINKQQQPLFVQSVGSIGSTNTAGTVLINRQGSSGGLTVTPRAGVAGGAGLAVSGSSTPRTASVTVGSPAGVNRVHRTITTTTGAAVAPAVGNNRKATAVLNRVTSASNSRATTASVVGRSVSSPAPQTVASVANNRSTIVSRAGAVVVNNNKTTAVVSRSSGVTLASNNSIGSTTVTNLRPTLAPGTRLQSISAHQLAGLKLVPHQMQQGVGQTLVGQKLLVQGNKVLLQGSKMMSGTVQQLMSVQQQPPLAGGGGVQRVTLVSAAGGPLTTTTITSSSTTPSTMQRLLIGQHHAQQAQASGAPLLSLGGKQVLLATKAMTGGSSQHQQQLTNLGQVLLTGDKLGQMVANIGGQQLVLAAAPGGGQQIVVPASALQGGQLALKGLQGLQAFHTLKVIPGGSGSTVLGSKGKQLVARVLQQQAPRVTVAPNTTQPPSTTAAVRPES